ncbi:hypothetical protein BSL78_14706 [Apostichopus japonicus]|uniref:Integrase catalytic domain-containing protein n=1 Tax=Stichopus japonicus TaxID=307972 RepID=A0A2G8KKH4_STIJA|nr:hypothetical protein BSL78_14706 [Apostichopus japonicus]
MPGKVHLETDPAITPVVIPPRRVPVAIKPMLKAELKRLEELNVIQKVTKPTDWVSSLVSVTKSSGKLRVCIDPQPLNKALKRGHYPLPVIEDILPQLAKVKVFSKADCKEGFLQCELDNESSYLTTFQTPWGRERSIKLNKDKFEYKCEEVAFIGHVLSKEGLRPDPRKVEAILKMPKPENVADIQRFVGMVKYLSKFLPALSDKSEPLRRLTHKDVDWTWSIEQDRALAEIKQLVTTAPVLKYFNPDSQTEGQGDASEKGLGFCLIQNGQPITYCSRALTPAETRYSQIEKELLAQVFGLERNHQYAYGRRITLWTDHKPLVAIANKPLASAPKRLQRLLLRLFQYDIEIRYKPGKEMYLADTLSRAFLNTQERSVTEAETESINMIDFLPISKATQRNMQEATDKDPSLKTVKDYIVQGWPEHKHFIPYYLHPYYSMREELSVQDGIVFKGQQCVIPESMRNEIKEEITQRSYRNTKYNSTCKRQCVLAGDGQRSERYDKTLHSLQQIPDNATERTPYFPQYPERPWEKIGCDLFTVDSKDYLCTVDYYSDIFEVDHLSHKKDSQTVIKMLKKHFSNHGIPNQLFSDNGPPFNSTEFSEFSDKYQFDHTTSSPRYPQSNGKVESAVKIAKNLIKKTSESKGDFYLNLLNWRNTPTEGLNSSPAQRLYSRRTKTLIPTVNSLLKPKVPNNVKSNKQKAKAKQAKYYNRGVKELRKLNKGETVRVKINIDDRQSTWEKAQVQEQRYQILQN